MRKKREFIDGAFYHVTSRTNNKIRVFERKLGQKIMLLTLEGAKEKFEFTLTNFCIMPNHIHLLIRPDNGENLSKIMHWIKTRSAKRWNFIHGSKDHMWGHRFFARAIKDTREYYHVMNYIDQNPVVVGLALSPAGWKASGAFYKANNLSGLVDYFPQERMNYIKLLPEVPGTG
jgi:putative transposase